MALEQDPSSQGDPLPTSVPRRAAPYVMRLSRLGSFHQCRLSFMRQFTRRFARECWQLSRPHFEIDADCMGYAVYTVSTGIRHYSLVVFSHALQDENRSDRVIAEAWDATFTLFDGIPAPEDIKRLSKNVPFQEAGRVTERELTLSRANKSVRLWAHVVECLAAGYQPDRAQIEQVGYLMRTTAVYGSGKFGAADRAVLAERPEFQAPFQAEMLSVYLFRAFVVDLVNHAARNNGGKRAVALDTDIARQLGIGNSTGLGMAPFIINHPMLFNNWIMAREEAIARVRSLKQATAQERACFAHVYEQMKKLISHWYSEHPRQIEKLAILKADLQKIDHRLTEPFLEGEAPWDKLLVWAQNTLSEEGEEFLASLMLEPYGDIIDGLGACMADTYESEFVIDGQMTVKKVRGIIKSVYGWALSVNWEHQENCARAWYVSEEKLEPRLGERFEEPIEAYEQPLAPARDAARVFDALEPYQGETPIAVFLLKYPEHRYAIRRAQIAQKAPYSEIRDNTIAAGFMPIDMLRAKLSFFGATRFDPRSDRWVRISMFAGAPLPKDLTEDMADFWVFDGV